MTNLLFGVAAYLLSIPVASRFRLAGVTRFILFMLTLELLLLFAAVGFGFAPRDASGRPMPLEKSIEAIVVFSVIMGAALAIAILVSRRKKK